MPSYVVNGRKYNSIDEMSAADRQAYQQAMDTLADNGGFPNLLDKNTTVQTTHTTNVSQQHVINGSSDQLNAMFADRDGNGIPDIMEANGDQLNAMFADRDGNGIPDIMQEQSNFSSQQASTSSNTWKTPTPSADPLASSALPWNQPRQSNGFLLGLIVGGVAIGAALLAWYLLM
ncbi:hypothetical protein [Herpetosiphon giganteus]|uniref:hypothetical protein n=1 Tax=Herpetosiphon giganteus TaxID=2029754 RepID=UPI00195D135E|nr:hypothetical protein [Herpetosiphon giganteus]MBM7841952.1 hypothetical protein [Herpetosiphon giganteus]